MRRKRDPILADGTLRNAKHEAFCRAYVRLSLLADTPGPDAAREAGTTARVLARAEVQWRIARLVAQLHGTEPREKLPRKRPQWSKMARGEIPVQLPRRFTLK